ncbi:MAG: hypothetical protein ABJB66_13725 [Gemmatimonadaceae bacterium]
MRYLSLLAPLVIFWVQVVPLEMASAQMRDTTAVNLTLRALSIESGPQLLLELTIPRTREPVTVFQLPNEWAGRSGLFRNIIALEATSLGAAVSSTNDSSRIRVTAPVGTPLTIRWRLNITPPSSSAPDAHNHSVISRDWAQLVGHDALVLPKFADTVPVKLKITFAALERGAAVATSFGSPREGDSTVVARGMLSDFQYAVYTFAINKESVRAYRAPVPGGRLTLLVRGTFRIADSTLQHSVQQVIAMERKFWGGKSPANYLVTIGVASRGTLAGTRLTNAFVADLDSTRSMDAGVTTLFAHELMHEWLGGLIHQVANARDGFIGWFTEGFTDYMAHRLLWQSGLLSDSAYVDVINNVISAHSLSSARDSSWNAVVNGYWKNSDMQREPYLRGELLAMQLDQKSRNSPIKTPNSVLDRALVALTTNKRFQLSGIADSALRSYFVRTVGPFAAEYIVKTISGGDIQLAKNTFGVCAEGLVEPRGRWDPGFDVDSSLKVRKVIGVRADGPAAAAGLADGLTITRTNIWYNDPSKTLSLGIKFADSAKTISYSPVSRTTVDVQRFQFAGKACATTPAPH